MREWMLLYQKILPTLQMIEKGIEIITDRRSNLSSSNCVRNGTERTFYIHLDHELL